MNRTYRIILFISMLLPASVCAADAADRYQQLLQYRIQNDSACRKLQLESQIAAHQAEKTKLESLVTVELGSEDTSIKLNKDPNKIAFSTSPYVNVQLPSYNNTGIRLSLPYARFTPPPNNAGGAQGEMQQRLGAGFMISTDIYSTNAAAKRLMRSQAEFAAAEAEQKAQEGIALAEKQFLTDLQHLFDTYTALLEKELAEVQAEIRSKQADVQGYPESSTKMRTTKLALMSAKREKQAAALTFGSEFKLFSESCGQDIPEADRQAFLTELAAAVPVQKLADIEQFPQASYKALIQAEHTAAQNSAKQDIELSPFSLGAEAGYRFGAQKGEAFSVQHNNEHTISAGIHMKFPGGKIYTGVDTPLSDPSTSTIKLGVSWNPFFIRYQKLAVENAELARNIDQIRIEDAKRAYQRQVQSSKISSEAIAWQQKITTEELSLYRQNAQDHAGWYKAGLITSFDHLQAVLEYRKAVIRNGKANAAVIIFNHETKLLFQ